MVLRCASFRRLKIKQICIVFSFVVSIYLLYQIASTYVFPENTSIKGKLSEKETHSKKTRHLTVEVWGKAAIGLYLWQHILEGGLEERLGGVWQYGFQHVNGVNLHFRTGPGVVPDKVPKDVEHLVLVLNGRVPAKVKVAEEWLQSLIQLAKLRNVAVVLLGNERCENEWIEQYLSSRGGPVQHVYIVYDCPCVDNHNFYQWPLGVATYRRFPVVATEDVQLEQPRRYVCNFQGTVYANSSRETLVGVLQSNNLNSLCFVHPRYVWLPQETEKSRTEYINILRNSDLTLNPVGMNAECYRIYEAMALGSIPVIEDRVTEGHCDRVPLRLLKKHKAPVEFINDWNDLPKLIVKYQRMPLPEIVTRRKNVLSWYIAFKETLRLQFIDTIKTRFNV